VQKYKINGKPIQMPDGWHDVKYNDAINIIENNLDAVSIFSLFSGIDKNTVRKFNKRKDISHFLQGFPFLNKLPLQQTPQIPRSLIYKGSRYHFPHVFLDDEYDFGYSTIGQIEDMKAIIVTQTKEITGGEDRLLNNLELMKLFPPVVAIYIQPIIEQEYNYKRAMKLADDIQKELSFKEIIFMGNFFLLKLGASTSGLKTGLHPLNWMRKKSKQAFRTLIRTLDSTRP